MSGTLDGVTVAVLVAPEGAEQVELTSPWEAVREAGGHPRLVSTTGGRVQAFHHLDRADTFAVDATVDRVGARDFDALLLPGGVANPDYLRTHERAVAFVREFFDTGRPVAAICHAAWVLVEADVVRGRTLTSYPSLRTDLTNAGAVWVDRPVVVSADGPNALVTSRGPKDLPVFNKALVSAFAATTVS
ncbi:type 1 glutamine amidotransferase domain-containing protein [Thermobifida cellulosilytica]|uniref:Glutamine amidotransferase n=1 Tax=Thermobifida cellulosilytica TB100 TaxID=665004 RepID=A0A147KML9_THECS|nr:type 1 glutamine amidotransferase domain-containing protein [Thermobifida cellulosilytica]KUP98537.1 glutamine amidotransferase [Thermobifida cellulosilytica TB100]